MAAPLSSGLFLLGGAASAAYAVVRHSSDRKNNSRPSSEGFCPATPSTPYPRSAASWLRVAGSSSPSKASVHDSEQCRSPAAPSSNMPQEGIPMRALEAGSLVCFYTSLGELVTVKPEGKAWVLHACLAPSPTSSESMVVAAWVLLDLGIPKPLSVTHALLQAVSDCHTSQLRQFSWSQEKAAKLAFGP